MKRSLVKIFMSNPSCTFFSNKITIELILKISQTQKFTVLTPSRDHLLSTCEKCYGGNRTIHLEISYPLFSLYDKRLTSYFNAIIFMWGILCCIAQTKCSQFKEYSLYSLPCWTGDKYSHFSQ